MEQLPKSLLYYSSQIAGFTRNNVKINSLNQTSLASNGVSQIRLALPVNATINLKSLSMHAKCVITGKKESNTAFNVYGLVPKGGIAAMLDRVTVSAAGVSLDNGVTPYYVISAIKDNLEKGNDKRMSDDRVLQESTITAYQDAQIGADAAGNPTITKYLVQNNFCGFTECEPSYLSMDLLPEVFITMQCASSNVIPVQEDNSTIGDPLTEGTTFGGSGCNFSLSEIYFTCDVCQFGGGMYDAINQRLLAERGSLDIPYPQYNLFSQTTNAGVGEIRGSVSCMSLDRVYVVARNNGGTVDGAVPGEAWTNQQPPVALTDAVGPAFQQRTINFAAADCKDYQFSLNNAPMPLWRPSALDAFNFVVNAEDRSYSKGMGGGVHSQKEWLNNKWCAMIRLNLDNDPRRLSGTNLSSVNSALVWSPSKDTAMTGAPGKNARQMIMVTKQTSVLRVGQSRAVSVIN